MINYSRVFILLLGACLFLNLVHGQCPVHPLKSYVTSDQPDDYLCSGSATITLHVDLPNNTDMSTVSWNCNWTGPSGYNNPTDLTAVGPKGVYSVVGTVTFSLTNGPSCSSIPFHFSSITIEDGNSISQSTYIPSHYWTFEPSSSSPISIDGVNYPIWGSGSAHTRIYYNNGALQALPVIDYQTDLMTIDDFYSSNGLLYTDFNIRNIDAGLAGPYTTVVGKVGNCADDGVITYHNYKLNNATKLTREFMIKLHDDFEGSKNHVFGDNIYLGLASQKITVYSDFTRQGAPFIVSKEVWLNGAGAKDWANYLDGEWHHFAITCDLEKGQLKLYVDGLCPEGFSWNYFTDPTDKFIDTYPVNTSQNQPHTNYTGTGYGALGHYGKNEFGQFDEYAIYSGTALPATIIYQHAQKVLGNSPDHYSFIDNTGYCVTVQPALATLPTSLVYISSDYPDGYAGGTGAGLIDNPMVQLKNSPFPRYKPNNQMIRNFPWYDFQYLGGRFTYDNSDYYQNAAEINEELALHWNYHTWIGAPNFSGIQKFANSHPEIPSSHITLMNQIDQDPLYPANQGFSTRSDRNQNHKYIKADGTLSDNWSPAAKTDLVKEDAAEINDKILAYMNGLQRPLDFLNENGEVKPIYDGYWNTEADINNGYNTSVRSDWTNTGLPWLEYLGFSKNRLREAYWSELKTTQLIDPNKTKFTFYSVDGIGGHSMYKNGIPSWNHIKKIQKNFPKNALGQEVYYSTPDFYPYAAHFWDGIVNEYHGTEWIDIARIIERWGADIRYSPYVCAGWREDPTTNIRPAQWLGLMKYLGVQGAEFYYGSYFSAVRKDAVGNIIYQDPRHWIWQTTIPSYAQAVFSRSEHIIKQGSMVDDPTKTNQELKVPSQRLKGGGSEVATLARKWVNPINNSDVQYLISSTYQIRSSGMAAREKSITLNKFDNNALPNPFSFQTRTQGSTYLLKKDEVQHTIPVMIYLDEWHESKHPTRWDNDFVIEAELEDNKIQVSSSVTDQNFMTVRTKVIDPQTGNERDPLSSGDNYNDFVSYYTFPNFNPTTMPPSDWGITSNSPKLTYRFRVTESNTDYQLFIRARTKLGSGSNISGINVNLVKESDNTQIYSDYAGCINQSNWKWYTQGLCNEMLFEGLSEGYYMLELVPENELVEIDQLILDNGLNRTPSFPTNSIAGFCGSALPNQQPYMQEVDFSWSNSCVGEVKFISQVWPKLNLSCLQNSEFTWDIVDLSGTYFANPAHIGPGNSSIEQSPSFFFPGPGDYEITLHVTINGITIDEIKTITINQNPIANPTANKLQVCEGESVQLAANAVGSGTLTYSWFPSLTLDDPIGQNPIARPVEKNGTANRTSPDEQNQFKVTVTDGNGCQSNAQVPPIVIKPPLDVTITSTDNSLCYGRKGATSDPVVLSVSTMDPSCACPASSPTYLWTTNNQLFPSSTTSGDANIKNVLGIESDRYSVTVTDANGCVGEASIIVMVEPSGISVDIGNGTNTAKISKCLGTSGILQTELEIDPINNTKISALGATNYSWKSEVLGTGTATPYSLGTSNTSAGLGNYSLPLVSTLYTITAEDVNGCEGKGYIWLDITDDINATITPETDVNCLGNLHNVNLTAGINGTANNPTYVWSPTIHLTGSTPNTRTFIPPGQAFSQKYTVRIVDGGCYSEATANLSVASCKKGNSTQIKEETNYIEKEMTDNGTIILFPNPNRGSFQLEFTGELKAETLQVVVIDLQGKIIEQKIRSIDKPIHFELEGLPRGVYFIRIFNEQHNFRMSTVID